MHCSKTNNFLLSTMQHVTRHACFFRVAGKLTFDISRKNLNSNLIFYEELIFSKSYSYPRTACKMALAKHITDTDMSVRWESVDNKQNKTKTKPGHTLASRWLWIRRHNHTFCFSMQKKRKMETPSTEGKSNTSYKDWPKNCLSNWKRMRNGGQKKSSQQWSPWLRRTSI